MDVARGSPNRHHYPREVSGSQFHFHPDDYLDLTRSEVPAFDELQDRIAAATLGVEAARILELGTGTGETSRRVLAKHPAARLTGIDESPEMLDAAAKVLVPEQIEALLVRRIEDPLPEGPFDLAISGLTIHHLDAEGKAALFRSLAGVIRRGGRFVMGDVVTPDDPADAITPLSPDFDLPSSVEDLLRWLREAGFQPHLRWASRDLAVISSDLR